MIFLLCNNLFIYQVLCTLIYRRRSLYFFLLRTLYYSIIHPQLNYGILVWGFQCNRIIKLQKCAIRTITRSIYNAHTSPLLKHMEILSVNDMLHQKTLTFHYKYVNKNLPYYLDSFNITMQGSLHNYNTRQRDNVRLNRTRIKMTDKCLRNYLPEQLNSVTNIVSSKIYTHPTRVLVCS